MNPTPSFIVQGLAGARSLRGTVSISGAKNAALKAMAATILFDAPVTLENISHTRDVDTLSSILVKLGAVVSWKNEHTMIIDPSAVSSGMIDFELGKGMRASIVLTGPLVGRLCKTSFPAPGGCVIGQRPIDLFLNGYHSLGGTVSLDESSATYTVEHHGINDAKVIFPKISVGATETLMMAAVLGQGTVILENCAREPEIGNVAEWLNSCGAHIEGIGTSTLTIIGTKGKLLSPKHSFVTIPDRIATGSFLVLAALCGEDITIKDCNPNHLDVVIELLKESGINVETTDSTIRVRNVVNDSQNQNKTPRPFNVITHEYPGFPTDLQPIIATYLTQTSGHSEVTENIFEGRFKYIEDLNRLGAKIRPENAHKILIEGPTAFTASDLNAHDIRAGFAIVIAALLAQGQSKITNVQLIDRGYEKLEEVLTSLGASIQRL